MKNQSILFVFFMLLLFSCNLSQKENPISDTDILPDVEEEVIDTNIFVVKEKCAVILHPDDAEIDEIKAKYGEEGLGEIASDIGFYSAQASGVLKEQNIKVVTTSKRKLLFIQEDGVRDTINRIGLEGDMIFFTPDRSPKITFTVDGASDLSYFMDNDLVDFSEGYWVSDKVTDKMKEDYIFRSFYKTSFVNDYPLLQYFDNGEITLEEVLITQKEQGLYKHPNEEVYFEFRGDALIRTKGGAMSGYSLVNEERINEN